MNTVMSRLFSPILAFNLYAHRTSNQQMHIYFSIIYRNAIQTLAYVIQNMAIQYVNNLLSSQH